MQHRTAPDQRLVTRIQESHGNDFQAVGFKVLDAIVAQNFGLATEAKHQWDVGSVDVRVEQANSVAELRKCKRQIYGECGLAYASFTGADRDDAAYARQGLRRGWLLTRGTVHMSVQKFTSQIDYSGGLGEGVVGGFLALSF
jgi:hypothetical protein